MACCTVYILLLVATAADNGAGEIVEALDKAKMEELASGKRDKDTMVVLYAPWCQFSQGLEADYETFASQVQQDKLRVAKYQADVDKEWSKTIGLTTYPTLLYMPAGSDKIVKYNSDRRTVESLTMWASALGAR
jgi:adenylyl-sulfate reductase (glutathione)